LHAFSQVAGFTEANAHLLPDYLPEARSKLAYDFPHATGAQDFDVSSICRNRCTDPEY
jgi:hypothetical protein